MTDITDPTALGLLKRAEALLSALHGSVARHDNLAADLGCAGCELRDQISAALPSLAVAPAVLPPATDRAASYRLAADAIESMQGYPHLILPEEIVAALRLLAAGEQPDPGSPAYIRRLAAGERDEQQAQQDRPETRTTAAKAEALGMTPTEYRAHCHQAAEEQIRTAMPGLYASVALRVEGALDEVQPEAHPAEHTWAAELHDPLTEEWVPGTRYLVRDRAVNALAHARSIGPTWRDGTPTERRLVRATTTYTVETPAAPVAVQPPVDTGEEARPRFVRVCIACPECDHTLDENGACANGCATPPAVVAEPGKENGRG